jgi:gamma-glutamyltranspeptidase/glutathione hydrolase
VWLTEARSYASGVVATPHYLASAAGAAMLADGGNAIDAALAANLTLAVVTPYMCGFGGDLLTMVWDGQVNAYRGVGRAPVDATAAKVCAQSGSDTMPVFGAHPVTVPGAINGWFTMLEKWGTRSFGDVATTALRYAEEGFPLTKRGAWFFTNAAELFSHFGLNDIRDYYAAGVSAGWVVQPELARTIRTLANDGPDAYYYGPIGAAIAERLQQAGGFMTADDITAHTRGVGRAVARQLPRRGSARDAPADARHDRARSVAHR